MRHLSYFLAAAALATAVITGCSSSTPVGPTDGGPDGQADTGKTKTDSGKPPKDSGSIKDGKTTKDSPTGMDSPMNMPDSPMTMPDTGTDGPCNFATFVLGLIANDTTATATPSANLGQSCTDDQKQSEFSTLFP